MANYTAADIKALREQTGAGMLDVKKALDEADGDRAKATEILRVKGPLGVTKREGRTTSNGLVTARAATARAPSSRSSARPTSLPRARSSAPWPSRSSTRPSPPRGRRRLAAQEQPRRRQDRPGAARRGQRDHRREDRGQAAVARVEAPVVVSYLHKTSPDLPAQIGVLVGAEGGDEQVARDVAMHIAAFSPTVLTRDEVDAATVENERRAAEATAKARASPRLPCRRSSRVASTATSARTSCSSSRSPRMPRRPWARSPRRRPAPRRQSRRAVPRRRLTLHV